MAKADPWGSRPGRQRYFRMDVFYGCLGVAAIILALGAVTSIPSILALVEKVALHDQAPRRPGPPPAAPPDGPPWGRPR